LVKKISGVNKLGVSAIINQEI